MHKITICLIDVPVLKPPPVEFLFPGKDEGGFGWLTLNYLLGKLGKAEAETVAAIDLGGGSVQEAFAMTDVVSGLPRGRIKP